MLPPAGLKSRFYGLDDEQCGVEELALQVGALLGRGIHPACFAATGVHCSGRCRGALPSLCAADGTVAAAAAAALPLQYYASAEGGEWQGVHRWGVPACLPVARRSLQRSHWQPLQPRACTMPTPPNVPHPPMPAHIISSCVPHPLIPAPLPLQRGRHLGHAVWAAAVGRALHAGARRLPHPLPGRHSALTACPLACTACWQAAAAASPGNHQSVRSIPMAPCCCLPPRMHLTVCVTCHPLPADCAAGSGHI